jgi:hypothetical protein
MTRGSSVALGAVAALVLVGAEGGGCKADREVPVQVVSAGPTCGEQGEGVTARLLASADDLRAAMAPQDTQGGGEGGAQPPDTLGAAEPQAKEVAPDFAREAVLLLSMGQQPSAGYALELARPVAFVKGKVAALQVVVRSPAPGAMTAQVVTRPCLVVKLAKEGLDEVKVANAEQKVLAGVKLR